MSHGTDIPRARSARPSDAALICQLLGGQSQG